MQAADLRHTRAAFLADGLGGRVFTAAYTAAVDEWLAELYAEVFAGGGGAGVALLAVGGYGRSELCPGSDLDLVLVHDGGRRVGREPEALWYPIWDAGFHLDHSVRTPREVSSMAAKDLKVMLGLLTARRVAGDPTLARAVLTRVRDDWTQRPAASIERLRHAVEERWRSTGAVAYMAEPDVKLSRGGLRDVEALRAAALATRAVRRVVQDPAVLIAHDDLLAVRVALHAVTGRTRDTLLRDDRDDVAARLGLRDGDALMATVSAVGRRVTWAVEEAWDRAAANTRSHGRRRTPPDVSPPLAVHDGELVVDRHALATVDTDDAVAFRLAAAAARTGLPMSLDVLNEIAAATTASDRWSDAARDAFVDLLGFGAAAIHHVEALDHAGVLRAYIPEWEAVRNRAQPGPYHAYSVDRHLLETAAAATALVRRVHRPDVLLVGALLHAIGGPDVADRIAERMGFDEDARSSLRHLVGDSALLSQTATRRDLDDPATIATVAARVGSVEQLDLLAALTEADGRATGPTAWGPWKAGSVAELAARARNRLGGAHPAPPPTLPASSHRSLMAERRVRVVADGDTVTIVAPDQPGVLAVIAGVFSEHRLDIRAAVAASDDGMVVDVFTVDASRSVRPDWARIEHDVAAALADPGALGARLEARTRSRAIRVPLPPPDVLVDNDASAKATVVEVRTADGPGVLYGLAFAFAGAGLDIATAKIETLGHEVVDTFYVTDAATGMKLVDEADVARMRAAIAAVLDG